MKSFAIAAFIGAAAAALPAPYSNHTTTAHASPTKDVRTTKVTEYTTYCPYPTTYIHGQKTYTVTEATTLTVKCPGGCYKPTADHPEAPRETPKCPAPGSTDHQGRYSCNPAHQYPAGQECKFIDGCFFILPPPKNTTVVMPPPKTETRVLTAYTTYCPQPTTFVHKSSTYTVSTATTLTLPCPGGCTVVKTTQPPARTTHVETTAVVPPPKETEHEMPPPKETQTVSLPPVVPHAPPPAPSTPAETHPVPEQPKPSTYAPPAPPAPSVSTAFRPSATVPASTTAPATYTGAASMQTAGALAAAGAMAAFFL